MGNDNSSDLGRGRGRYITCKICGHKFRFETDEQRLQWQANMLQCPSCKDLYCTLPKTERELHLLQNQFLKNRSEKCLNEMYHLLVPYTKSIILKTYRHVMQHPEDLQYFAENAVSYLIEEYYAKPNYKVELSFGGLLIFKIKQAIYGKMESEIDAISINYEFTDEHEVQYEDPVKYFDEIENTIDKTYLLNNLCRLIFGIEDYVDSNYENYIRELAMSLHLRKGEKYVDRFFQKFGREGKIAYLYTLKVLRKELHNMID